MKNLFTIFVLFLGLGISNAQTKKAPVKKNPKPVVSKYGALAVDRSNGFYYGFSYDYTALSEAENKALSECAAKGGNCSIVLSFLGAGCAAYRTVDGNVGSAYGWGVAKTKEAADAIAMQEVLKRSNGVNPSNFVWSCNSANTGTLKEIYNAKDEILTTIKIGNQQWTNTNLNVSKFRNGDEILEAKNASEWVKAVEEKKPAFCYLEYKTANGKIFGKMYNWYAVTDERGLAPAGYKIPTKDDWLKLINYLGDYETLAGRLKSKGVWSFKGKTELSGTDAYGFNALPGAVTSSGGSFDGIGSVANFWSSTPSKGKYIWQLTLYGHRNSFEKLDEYPYTTGMYVRLLKD